MHIEIERTALFDGLSKTAPITEKKSTLPILSHVLINTLESSVVFTATDLEVGLQISYDCTVKDVGSITLPSKKALEIVRELADGMVTLELLNTGRISIQSGKSQFELSGASVNIDLFNCHLFCFQQLKSTVSVRKHNLKQRRITQTAFWLQFIH